MRLERFRAFLALPLASLFLILLVCAFAIQRPASVGVRVALLRLRQPDQNFTCDGRWVFVELLDDGTTEVNLKAVPPQDLSAIVGKMMETRAERAVYLVPSPGISYARFIETYLALQGSAPDTHVGVLTKTVRDAFNGTSTASPCDLVWPADEFKRSD
jgi:hypothetical protein